MPAERTGESTSSSLIRGLKAKEPEAWRRLLHLYSPLVYSACRRCKLSADDAADVLQEVFKAVAQGIGEFRRDRPGDTFRGWLRTIIRTKIVDHISKFPREERPVGGSGSFVDDIEASASDSSLDPSVDPHGWGGVVRRACDLIRGEFEDRTWQAFWLTTVEDRPVDDVALQLGMTAPAVRQARYKVRRRLREELGDLE